MNDATPSLAHRTRATPLPGDLESAPYDVAVIGAGINGCGIARDAAMRGLRVLLVDMGDIGAQTTSWSTRLIHGGLRYLEHFELSLVRESLRERETLLTIAPHLVEPLRFLVPVYAGHRRGPLTIRAGMLAYDALSVRKMLPRHRMLTRDEALAHEQGLKSRGLRGAALYYDAQVTFPERLALENAISAAQHGCDVATYLRVVSIDALANCGARITMLDQLEGVNVSATARTVVNATGPWVDDVAPGAAGQRHIGGAKGSHIVVGPFPGAPRSAVYSEAPRDRRPFFVIPWNEMYLIGTTDNRFSGDPALAVTTLDESRYLIDQTNMIFPRACLDESSVLFTYSGVRPLPYSEHAAEPAITRRHTAVKHDPPYDMVLSVVGGKLTTYRELAERVTDRIFNFLGRVDPGASTARMPLPGAGSSLSMGQEAGTAHGIGNDVAERLKRVYGSRWSEVVSFAANRENTRTLDTTAVLRAEMAFALDQEFAQTLEDVFMRRTMIGMTAGHGVDALDDALAAIGENVGWTDERKRVEREGYVSYLSRFDVPMGHVQ